MQLSPANLFLKSHLEQCLLGYLHTVNTRAFFIFFISVISFISFTWQLRHQDCHGCASRTEGMQENPGQESRWKSRRRRRHPLQIEKVFIWALQNTLERSIDHDDLCLYQLVWFPNLLKISVAEWYQISKYWTTDRRVTHFQRILKTPRCYPLYLLLFVGPLIFPVPNIASQNSWHKWQMLLSP